MPERAAPSRYARFAAEQLALDERVDARAAYATFQRCHPPPRALAAPRRAWSGGAALSRAAMSALAAVAAVTLGFATVPPLRVVAAGLLERSPLTRVVAVLQTPGGAAGGSVLQELAAVSRAEREVRRSAAPLMPSVAAASRRSGFRLRVPTDVPAEIRTQQRVYVQPTLVHLTYRLEAARARSRNLTLPRSLAGASVAVDLCPCPQVRYGEGRVRDRLAGFGQPTVVVAEAHAPQVTVRGATLARIAAWLATEPSLPPALAAQVRALGDPLVALPLPVRVDREHAQRVTVDGVQGYGITSFFNRSSYVVWVKDDIVYAVGGTYPLERMLAVANSLR